MRIVIIIPPYRGLVGFPLGIASLAKAIDADKKHRVHIIDFAKLGFNNDEAKAFIESNLKDIDIFGISSTTLSYKSALEIAGYIKNVFKSKLVIFGGIHPTITADSVLTRNPQVDIVVRGEAEETLPSLLNNISKGRYCRGVKGCSYRDKTQIIHNEDACPILNLDKLGFRYNGLVSRRDYSTEVFHERLPSTSLITSRGCLFRCSYCIQSRNYEMPRIRYRSVENVIEEIIYLISQGYVDLHFEDDIFTFNRNRIIQLCNELAKLDFTITWNCETRPDHVDYELLEKMKSAGCTGIFYGVESFSQSILDQVDRRIDINRTKRGIVIAKEIGLKVFASIQIGLPGESEKTIETTIRTLEKIQPWKVGLNLATLYPGTLWFKQSGYPPDIYENYPLEPELDEFLFEYVGHGMGGLHPYFINPKADISAPPVHDINAIRKIFEKFKRELGQIVWTSHTESLSRMGPKIDG